jgi:hypothetical protein
LLPISQQLHSSFFSFLSLLSFSLHSFPLLSFGSALFDLRNFFLRHASEVWLLTTSILLIIRVIFIQITLIILIYSTSFSTSSSASQVSLLTLVSPTALIGTIAMHRLTPSSLFLLRETKNKVPNEHEPQEAHRKDD